MVNVRVLLASSHQKKLYPELMLASRVLSTGGGGGGPNTPASPPKFLTINSVKVMSATAACSYTCVLCTGSCYTAIL